MGKVLDAVRLLAAQIAKTRAVIIARVPAKEDSLPLLSEYLAPLPMWQDIGICLGVSGGASIIIQLVILLIGDTPSLISFGAAWIFIAVSGYALMRVFGRSSHQKV